MQTGGASTAGGRSGRRGCLGCATALVVAACACITLGLGGPLALRALRPSAQELLGGAVDPVATEAVNRVLDESGLTGARAVVLPIRGGGQMAILTLDESAGFRGAGSAQGNDAAFRQVLQGLTAANAEGDLGITHTAIDYRDEAGASLFTVAASQDAIEAYSQGQVSQDEFLGSVEVDLSNLIDIEQVNALIQEGTP